MIDQESELEAMIVGSSACQSSTTNTTSVKPQSDDAMTIPTSSGVMIEPRVDLTQCFDPTTLTATKNTVCEPKIDVDGDEVMSDGTVETNPVESVVECSDLSVLSPIRVPSASSERIVSQNTNGDQPIATGETVEATVESSSRWKYNLRKQKSTPNYSLFDFASDKRSSNKQRQEDSDFQLALELTASDYKMDAKSLQKLTKGSSSKKKTSSDIREIPDFFLSKLKQKEKKVLIERDKLRLQVQEVKQLNNAFYVGKQTHPFFVQISNAAASFRSDATVVTKPKSNIIALIEAPIPDASFPHVGFTFTTDTQSRTVSPAIQPQTDVSLHSYFVALAATRLAEPSMSCAPLPSLSFSDAFEKLNNNLDAPFYRRLIHTITVRPLEPPSTERCRMWTEKYHPQSMDDIVGASNQEACKQLYNWLRTWRPPTNSHSEALAERRKRQAKRPKKNDFQDFIVHESSSGGDHDDYVLSCEVHEDPACIFRVLHGPVGSGKTSMIHAVANSCGYSVFEINSTQKRSAKEVVSILGEAVLSENVSSKAASFLRKSVTDRFGDVYRQSGNPGGKPSAKNRTRKRTQIIDDDDSDEPAITETPGNTQQTLVVIDDVDVVLEQDKNIWTGIITLLQMSKVPIVLTCTESPLTECNPILPQSQLPLITDYLEVIYTEPPSADEMALYLSLVMLCENRFVDPAEMKRWVCACSDGSVRQCLLMLQVASVLPAEQVTLVDPTLPVRVIDKLPGFGSQKLAGCRTEKVDLTFMSTDAKQRNLNALQAHTRRYEIRSIVDCLEPSEWYEMLFEAPESGLFLENVEYVWGYSQPLGPAFPQSTGVTFRSLGQGLINRGAVLQSSQITTHLNASNTAAPIEEIEVVDNRTEWFNMVSGIELCDMYNAIMQRQAFFCEVLPWISVMCKCDLQSKGEFEGVQGRQIGIDGDEDDDDFDFRKPVVLSRMTRHQRREKER